MGAEAAIWLKASLGGTSADMTMVRDLDALLAQLDSFAQRPFSWRDHDCVRYCAACVAAQGGGDVLHGLSWRTQKAANRLLSDMPLLDRVDALFNRIDPAAAMRGDIAGVADDTFGLRLMIVEGAMLSGPGEAGRCWLPRADMIMAWDAMSLQAGAAR